MSGLEIKRDDIVRKSELFEYYKYLLSIELGEKNSDTVYALTFARLLAHDNFREFGPLKNIREKTSLMLGTDERDLFVPVVIGLIQETKTEIDALFDIGCGDGETTKNFLPYLTESTCIDALDPNGKYLERYKNLITSANGPQLRRISQQGIDEEISKRALNGAPEGPFYDLILAIHMIYFTNDNVNFIQFALDQLHPGGTAVFVFADELKGFTGKMVSSFKKYRDENEYNSFILGILKRHELFGITETQLDPNGVEPCIRKTLSRNDFRVVYSAYQPSRLYGHDIADIYAFSFITALPSITGSNREKIEFIDHEIRNNPEKYDLRLETTGIRKRMLSVSEPQVIVILQKL